MRRVPVQRYRLNGAFLPTVCEHILTMFHSNPIAQLTSAASIVALACAPVPHLCDQDGSELIHGPDPGFPAG
ncbi:hypothetical protein OF83DRAFT_1107601 [Amylostereum chailletii]|nr:hypothetical protein OF83DRAFT_1107601 [Amylostereum chailletii]